MWWLGITWVTVLGAGLGNSGVRVMFWDVLFCVSLLPALLSSLFFLFGSSHSFLHPPFLHHTISTPPSFSGSFFTRFFIYILLLYSSVSPPRFYFSLLFCIIPLLLDLTGIFRGGVIFVVSFLPRFSSLLSPLRLFLPPALLPAPSWRRLLPFILSRILLLFFLYFSCFFFPIQALRC